MFTTIFVVNHYLAPMIITTGPYTEKKCIKIWLKYFDGILSEVTLDVQGSLPSQLFSPNTELVTDKGQVG